jgi:aminocarboxymuconate-semialdehyde decarboxylase
VNPFSYIGKFWIDSLVHNKTTMRFILETMGENTICLGSDYPFPLGEHHPGKLIEEMDLPEYLVEKLLEGNAKKWLQLD